MRQLIIDGLYKKMDSEPELFFLNADMGINLVEKFGEKFPDRYANVGIAEQNLISICAGLAHTGFKPFAYTISNFLIHRCFEQIRNDIVLHNYPVVLLGTSTGFDNAPLGPTHHVVDDWGCLRGIPGIDIFCPSTASYAKRIIDELTHTRRPCYVRIPKGEGLDLSDEHIAHLEGKDKNTVICTYGGIAGVCYEAIQENPGTGMLVFNRLVPLDEDVLTDCLRSYQHVVVVEDHFGKSGLYGMLCEIILRRELFLEIQSVAPTAYQFSAGICQNDFFKDFGACVASISNLVRM